MEIAEKVGYEDSCKAISTGMDEIQARIMV